jgi:hypothetical protein
MTGNEVYDKHMHSANRPRRRHRPRSFSEKFWQDDHGHVVVWQKPNLFLYSWAASTFFNLFAPVGWLHTILGYIGLVALIVWAILETYSGVDYFRRLLGGLILLAILVVHFSG